MPFQVLRDDPIARVILLNSRLPRVLGALLVGAALGGAGAAFQLVFANPLVEPGFLGVSQGAAFGAALTLVLGARMGVVPGLGAFAFALLALVLSSTLARRFRFGGAVLRLVLAGIAVSALFSAALAVIKYTADPLSQLPDIAYWTLGSLSGMNWAVLGAFTPAVGISLLALYLLRNRMDVLSLEDGVARSLGVRPGLERGLVLVFAALGVAASVAVSGIVSWAGLVVPHAARALVGSDARSSIPASMVIGAAFMVFCDTLARTAFPGELPLGAAVSFLGALLFVRFLTTGKARVVR
jgi:iron complex transport system permease protein